MCNGVSEFNVKLMAFNSSSSVCKYLIFVKINKSLLFYVLHILPKEKGTLILNVSDLFNSRKRNSTNYTPNRENPTNISDQTFQWRVRQISLNFTYRFNQQKNQKQKDGRQNGGGEEFEG